VLHNRSLTRDALNDTVKVRGSDSQGRAFTSDETTITLIPAATNFVVTGSLVWGVSLDVARISTILHVGKTASRGRRLPPVKHASLTNGETTSRFTGWIVNPYKRPLPEGATVYGVFLDNKGRIVDSDSDITNAVVRRGASVPFELDGFPQLAWDQTNPIASVKVSVDPCGFGGACPIPGAP
jgi:hypothetical protein